MAYTAVLFLHSWLRWFVLVLGAAVLLRLLTTGVVAAEAVVAEPIDGEPVDAGTDVTDVRTDLRMHRAFIAAIDLQFVLGLALYLVLSPTVRAARSNMGVAMSDDMLRFYFVEHAFGMITAVAAAHFAWSGVRSGSPATRRVIVAHATWLLVTLASIPWPFMPYGRPLLRLILS